MLLGNEQRPKRPRRGPDVHPATYLLVAVAIVFAAFALITVVHNAGNDSAGGASALSDTKPAQVPDQIAPGVARGSGGEPTRKAFDPLAFDASFTKDLERRAAAGYAHPLYTNVEGGAAAGAERTSEWRDEIETATRGTGFDPDVVEGLVYLESSGRPNVYALGDVSNATGLTQIVASTGQGMLAMKVDVAKSRSLTKRINKLDARGRTKSADKLRAKRRKIDERFDPQKALAATMRYLTSARETFGREDLAVVSYHMGIGNLEDAIRDYADDRSTPVAQIVARDKISYAKLFFDTSPLRDPDAYATLTNLSDDSKTYYWRILAAENIMRMYREDPGALSRIQDLQDNKGSAEEVLHPPATTLRFEEPDDIKKASDDGKLIPLPLRGTRKLGFVVDPQMGQLAKKLKQKPALYQQLRPEALSLLIYLGAGVKAIVPRAQPLRVTSSVRDQRYQNLLLQTNPEATSAFSLHTTGYTFDILRKYGSKKTGAAFEFMLDRLQALNLIAWVREPAAIHVTVSSDAKRLSGLLDKLPKG
jgi:soluble lytic murein transglycosylase-like protein